MFPTLRMYVRQIQSQIFEKRWERFSPSPRERDGVRGKAASLSTPALNHLDRRN